MLFSSSENSIVTLARTIGCLPARGLTTTPPGNDSAVFPGRTDLSKNNKT